MQEAMRKETPGKAWHPIEGLPDDAHTWRNEPCDRAREEWREVRAALARRGTDHCARGAVAAGDACRTGAGSPRDLEAAVGYYEMAVSSENVGEAPGTRDRAVRGALGAIREAGPGSPLKEREAVRKERL